MPTPLDGRRPKYLDAYARQAITAARFDRIKREVQDEQDRVQYLDSLIGQERQTLAGLQDVFRAPPQDLTEAKRLLDEQGAIVAQEALLRAGGDAAAADAKKLSGEEVSTLATAIKAGDPRYLLDVALSLVQSKPATAQRVLSEIKRAGKLADSDLKAIEAEAAKNKGKGKSKGGAADGALADRQQAFAEALESAYFAGPSGIRGGFDGLEVVNLRGLTADALRERAATALPEQAKRLEARAAALDKSGFATADDALDAALEVVRTTGDPKAIQDPYARQVYEEARSVQAYRNDQRADFEQEVLDSRKRLASLEADKARITEAYDDPAQETLRRELEARGYSIEKADSPTAWKNAYLKYQKTPDYNAYLMAHELTSSALADGKPLGPTSKGETLLARYTQMQKQAGKPISIADLRKQLDKANVRGPEQDKAIAWTMAFWELGGPEQNAESVSALAQQRGVDAKQAEEAQKYAAKVSFAAQQAKTDAARAEFAAQRPPEQNADFFRLEYNRLRAAGYEPYIASTLAREAAQKRQPGTKVEVPKKEVEPSTRAPRPSEGGATPPGRERRRFNMDTGEFVSETPAEPDIGTPDPSGGPYSFKKLSSGDYQVFKNGVPTGKPARRGTTAFKSIESVLAGGAPIKPATKPEVKPEVTAAAPAPASEVDQIKALISSGTLKPGSAQYNAALDRLDELEGM